MRNKLLFAGILSFAAAPAFAGEPCRSAKDIARLGQSFYGNHPDLTNIITPEITLAFKGINGSEPPTAILYRHEGKEDILPIVDGRLTQLEKLATWSKDGEMCSMVGDELAPATEGDSVEANMGFYFPYKRRDGLFPVEELKEGAKDGSKIMKGARICSTWIESDRLGPC